MLILALCILCNVVLAVIFKGFAQYRVDNLNAIIVNYLVCIVAASAFIGEWSVPLDVINRPWFIYALFTACFFIIGFNVLALSFQKCGVALTVIIQKMSLVLPAAFAITLYGEDLNLTKGTGIALALGAVVLVNLPERQTEGTARLSTWLIILLFLTWFISGLIEITLFYVEAEKLLSQDSVQFTATSFCLAAVIGSIYTLFRYTKKRIGFSSKEFLGGLILGIPNFFTIYLLLVLLGKGWEGSMLFPMNNVGILLLTALVGLLFYHEKVNSIKATGLAMATGAIILIGIS